MCFWEIFFAANPSSIGTNCYVMEYIGGDMNSGFSKSICVKVNATDWVGTWTHLVNFTFFTNNHHIGVLLASLGRSCPLVTLLPWQNWKVVTLPHLSTLPTFISHRRYVASLSNDQKCAYKLLSFILPVHIFTARTCHALFKGSNITSPIHFVFL